MSAYNSSHGSRGVLTQTGMENVTEMGVTITVVSGLLSLATIATNALVLTAFCLDRACGKHYFIVSLSVSDLLTATLSLPLATQYFMFGQEWLLGPVLCDVWLTVDYSICRTAHLKILLITLDRYLSVKMPIRYCIWRTENRVVGLIVISWMFPAFFFICVINLPRLYWDARVDNKCVPLFMANSLFTIILSVCVFWIPMFFTIFLYVLIYKIAESVRLQNKFRSLNKYLRRITLVVRSKSQSTHKSNKTKEKKTTFLWLGDVFDPDRRKNSTSVDANFDSESVAFISKRFVNPRDSMASSRTSSFGRTESLMTKSSVWHPILTMKPISESFTGSSCSVDLTSHALAHIKHYNTRTTTSVEPSTKTKERSKSVMTDRYTSSSSVDPTMRTLGHTKSFRTNTTKDRSVKHSTVSFSSYVSSVTTEPISHTMNRTAESFWDSTTNTITTTSVDPPSKKELYNSRFVGGLTSSLRRVSEQRASIRQSQERARSSIRSISWILGIFVVCFVPWNVVQVLETLRPGCVNCHVYHVVFWLYYINSFANPILYALRNPSFKKAFVRYLRLDFHRT